MTRKKWNRLRRQRPELFGCLPPFEKWNEFERGIMRPVSKAHAIAVMTGYHIAHGPIPKTMAGPFVEVGLIKDLEKELTAFV